MKNAFFFRTETWCEIILKVFLTLPHARQIKVTRRWGRGKFIMKKGKQRGIMYSFHDHYELERSFLRDNNSRFNFIFWS